jgi:GAF domain-containing protein/CheY-like chemotaxis protein
MTMTTKTTPLHQPIMRRATPIVIGLFALFTFFVFMLVMQNAQQSQVASHQLEMDERLEAIEEPLQTLATDSNNLSRRDVTLLFSRFAANEENAVRPSPNAQIDLVQEFLNIANDRVDTYDSISFINTNGSIWTQVFRSGGLLLDTNLQLQTNVLADDLYFQQVRETGGSLVTPFYMQTDQSGGQRPVVASYSTVRDANNLTVGYIRVVLNGNILLQALETGETDTIYQWIILDNAGVFLLDNRRTPDELIANPIQLADVYPNTAEVLAENNNQIEVEIGDASIASSASILVDGLTRGPWTLLLIETRPTAELPIVYGSILSLVILVVGSYATLAILRRILIARLAPVQAVQDMFLTLSEEAAGTEAAVATSSRNAALGDYNEAFNRIARRLSTVSREVDREVEKRGRNLETASRISREISGGSRTEDLMQRTVDMIWSEFRLYHSQVFLLDDIQLNAVLVFSHGDIGTALLAEDYRVPVNSLSAVGKAAVGQAVLVRITQPDGDIPFIPNPLLPDAQSQLTVPLNAGGQIIGVLDVYGYEVDAFTTEDLPLLRMLADQLALALQKSRQIVDYQQLAQQNEALNRQMTRDTWRETEKRFDLADSYQYDLMAVKPGAAPSVTESGLSAPITIRGEVIGTLDVAAPEGVPFAQADQAILQAVAERVALAIEGARLFKETQTSLSITSALYDLSRNLSEAGALDDILRAIMNTVAQDATTSMIWLFDEKADLDTTWLQLAKYYTRLPNVTYEDEFGVHVPDSPFLSTMQPNQVSVIADASRDTRLDTTLQNVFNIFQAKASVFVPFSVRGQWRGLLMLLFPNERRFSDAEGRIFTALIDQSGVAIDNRLLIRQTELTLDQIERLYAASRQINTALSPVELLQALLAANADLDMTFEIGILEGPVDDSGWPTLVRIVAYAEPGKAEVRDFVQPVTLQQMSGSRVRDIGAVNQPDSFSTVFPLFSANQPIALLYLRSQTLRELPAEDYEIYKALAGQMSTVLENQRLLEQTSEALDETRRLYTTSNALSAATDAQAAYRIATETLVKSAPMLRRAVVSNAGPNPEFNAAYFDISFTWSRDNQHPVKVGDRMAASAWHLGQLLLGKNDVVYIPNIAGDKLLPNPVQQTLLSWGSRSVAIMPLVAQRRWLGMILVESDVVDAFDEQFLRFLRATANQTAITVENLQLFDEARAEAQRALALAEVGQLAAQIGADFERNLEVVFARVAEAGQYDRWQFTLVNETDQSILDVVTQRVPGSNASGGLLSYSVEVDDHPLVYAVRRQRMLVINDPSSYPSFANSPLEQLRSLGKLIATPVFIGTKLMGALTIGRSLDQPDLDERDEQLITTLTAQIGVALENRRLFDAAEQEREFLRSIMETMPTGIIVLEPGTLKPIQANAQAEILLGQPINYERAFTAEDYNLIRTGTNVHYPVEEMPVMVAETTGSPAFADDIAAVNEDGGQLDLLLNAAPIYDGQGRKMAIITAVQDISNLRGLENTLQGSLREQIALYEATRSLSEAQDVEQVLDSTVTQLYLLEPLDGYLLLMDEQTGALQPMRSITDPQNYDLPQSIFHTDAFFVPNLEDSTEVEADARDLLLGKGALAFTTVPMRTRDILLGWIVVLYDRILDFANDNERFLTTLADNAAVAIDNRNLQRRTEDAFQEATILYETSRALANVTSSEQIVDAVISKLNLNHLDQIFMAMPIANTPDSDLLVAVNWQRDPLSGINLQGVTLNAEQFPAWRLITSSQMILVSDANTDANLNEMEQMGLLSTDTQSLVVLPLRSGNRRLGVLWMASNQTYPYGDREARILQSFAEQASLSMEASRLLDQTERRARQLSTSAQVSQIASSILDVNELLPRIVDLIRDSFGYDHVQVFLMDAADQFAVLRASTGEAGKQLLSINHRLAKTSKSVIGQVTTSGQPVIALDTADARFVHKPNPYLPLTRSEMALPLIVKNRVVGALDVQSNTPNAFAEEDVNVLTTLANQISVALDNARLFEEAETRARDMSFLFNVSSVASAPDRSLRDSLQDVASLVRADLDVLTVGMYLAEEHMGEHNVPYRLLRPVAMAGSDQPLSELSEILVKDHGDALSRVAVTLQPYVMPDLEAEPTYVPISTEALTAAAVPMITSNQLVGIIVVEDQRKGFFNTEVLNLLTALTSSLSAVVQNNQLLEQMQESNEQLRELDRLKSDFLANMSHELRTPLNSIIGFSRVILKGIDGPLTEMQEQDLNTIYNSGTHLLGLINDILDQAKINSGKMDMHADYFDAKSMAEGVRSIGIGLIKDRPIDLRLEVASGLPKAFGDEIRTRQVLLNLVSNACKFTQQGNVTIRVYSETQATTGKDMIRVDVQDTGIGIAEKDIPLLFEAFRQVDSSLTRTVGGTGLGLPIAKSLIEMQGGQMLVHSVANVGSTFSILIPMEPTAPTVTDEDESDTPTVVNPGAIDDTARFSKSAQAEVKAEAQGPRETMVMPVMPPSRQLLLIEDNPDLVDQLRRALQREGFDIFSASIPLEAEAMASGLRPMVIIMNAEFANGAGWDILARLQERDDTSDIPVILIALDDAAQRAKATGAFNFLQRPFTPDQVVESVRAAQQASQTERILIIDDQEDSTRMVEQVLNESGQYRIFTAQNAQEGISLVARRRPNLIILDLRMPEKDGFTVLEELRANPETANIPIMIVTAETLSTDERDRLANLQVIYKTDLSQANYKEFIDGLKSHLTR